MNTGISNDDDRQGSADVRRAAGRTFRRRSGYAMLIIMFVAAVTAILIIGIVETETIQMSAVSNTVHYERATLLADAGVQHVLSRLEVNPNWTGNVRQTQFPPRSTYSYTASARTGAGGTVIVTGTGTSGDVSRTLQVTVTP